MFILGSLESTQWTSC